MNINYAVKITGNVSTNSSIGLSGSLNTNCSTLTGSLVASTVSRGMDPYEGPYTVLPSLEEQILSTNDKRMTGNVVIQKIPGTIDNNYGKITWDGSKITVS